MERIPEELQLDIDRLFPQVRLSTISTAMYRDTRDNPLEPSSGSLLAEDSDIALRSMGSQVGFGKMFLQAFVFKTVSPARRVVFASAIRVGLARAFDRPATGAQLIGTLPFGVTLPLVEAKRGWAAVRLPAAFQMKLSDD